MKNLATRLKNLFKPVKNEVLSPDPLALMYYRRFKTDYAAFKGWSELNPTIKCKFNQNSFMRHLEASNAIELVQLLKGKKFVKILNDDKLSQELNKIF